VLRRPIETTRITGQVPIRTVSVGSTPANADDWLLKALRLGFDLVLRRPIETARTYQMRIESLEGLRPSCSSLAHRSLRLARLSGLSG